MLKTLLKNTLKTAKRNPAKLARALDHASNGANLARKLTRKTEPQKP